MPYLGELIEGLSIIYKYNPDSWFGAEHDQIWAGDYTKIRQSGSKEDLDRLEELGWFEDADSYSSFV